MTTTMTTVTVNQSAAPLAGYNAELTLEVLQVVSNDGAGNFASDFYGYSVGYDSQNVLGGDVAPDIQTRANLLNYITDIWLAIVKPFPTVPTGDVSDTDGFGTSLTGTFA
jgi:hypothetical protein